MKENEIKDQILRLIGVKLQRISVSTKEIGNHFDLVGSGLLNSLEFVDLVASLEKELNCEVDFEHALDKGGFTTIGGLIRTFAEMK